MTSPYLRTVFGLSLRRCLRVAIWPAGLAAGAGWLLHLALAPRAVASLGSPWSADEAQLEAGGASSQWLVLPLFVVALVCAGTTVHFWPVFANRRPGADWIRRLQGGPWQGCGAAIAGALLAQLLLTLPLCTWLARGLGAPASAHAHVALPTPAVPLLEGPGTSLHFRGPVLVVDELQLRPFASMPAGGTLRASRLRVLADGLPLATTTVEFLASRQLARVRFAPRAIGDLVLQLEDGTVPLYFAPDSVVVIAAQAHATFWNGALLAGIGLVPTFLALAIACLCGSVAALATTLSVVACLLFVLMIGDVGPLGQSVLQVLRGHWLAGGDFFRASLPSLAVGSMAMILAMLTRRRQAR